MSQHKEIINLMKIDRKYKIKLDKYSNKVSYILYTKTNQSNNKLPVKKMPIQKVSKKICKLTRLNKIS